MLRTIEHIEHIRTSIINDVYNVSKYHSRTKKGGNFSIPRQVFCYIDYFGFIAYGGKKKNTSNAIKFINEYFPKEYQSRAELLYSMWRHGTVHQFEPINYYATNSGREIMVVMNWYSQTSNARQDKRPHLKCFSMEGINRSVYLYISTIRLTEDLLLAVDSFYEVLKKKKRYASDCLLRINSCGGKRSVATIESKNVIPIVNSQIIEAWNQRAGEINRSGKITQWFPPHSKI